MGGAGRRTTRALDVDVRFAVPLRGVGVDGQTRCVHYDGVRDVIALRAGCCDTYHPCHRCHDETEDHPARVWPRSRFDEPAVLCGVCQTTMTVLAYLASGHACPACGAAFNPGCAAHYDLYFEGGAPRPSV